MAVYITSLNSGSNGNCYYIGNDTEAVLIDAGISCRETERRMKNLGLDLKKVKAIFVTHEHSDHITGITVLSKKHEIPVYITEATLRASSIKVEPHLQYAFTAAQPIQIGQLMITGFRKYHDAIDPHSFMVTDGTVNIGIITDIGHACKEVVECFSQCHAVFLESNYCDDMLALSSYPIYLKKRISGNEGHLSNKEALELFNKYRGQQLSLLILSHLSQNNNKPELVNELFTACAGGTKIVVASRYKESELFLVDGQPVEGRAPMLKSGKNGQLQLF
ncbi:MBL fold metallo-hydrolase [Pseudoflavitalea sp. G-6-1-2]|uniref:MBL fold metallo-hydrolase n=1 Tax=Pseudoflavitalea sp. G-6-1-2 TaxID=2728841 RepID=UPI00146E87EE|nr:MBL fold metallo-hydrolase [Pseudoflavitalea sp. G-6-1-2]NML22226.1 MBL fold metallo-hydrolase [Pseudoflavitalea sp. G-6-1-2]